MVVILVSVSIGASGLLFSYVCVPDLPEHDERNCV
jgi:hypothetical protein